MKSTRERKAAGMTFLAEAFGTWLVERIADATLNRIAGWTLGTDQERALRRVARIAVRRTVQELAPGEPEQTQLEMVINEVFDQPMPELSNRDQYATMLEALQATVATQMAPLNDANLTETGKSSLDLLGISVAALADRLTSHILRQIIAVGTGGGSLTPLAVQLNDDITHLQGKRLEVLVNELSDVVRRDARLIIPNPSGNRSILSYADRTIEYVGRESELAELHQFLQAPEPFSWWLWFGPAGIGKSRLALELCEQAPAGWDAGFMEELSQDYLNENQFRSHALIVVDYASQRASWLSDAILRLSRREAHTSKVRILILERSAAGAWWDIVRRLHRHSESLEIAGCQYDLPRLIGGMNADNIAKIVRSVAVDLGHAVSEIEVDDIVQYAATIDSYSRPLFAAIAAIDKIEGDVQHSSRDEVLRTVLDRAEAQISEAVGDFRNTERAKNLLCFSTTLGGISFNDYALGTLTSSVPSTMLPEAFDVVGNMSIAALVRGLDPDILGELFVLDRLDRPEPEALASMLLVNTAWEKRPDNYRAFVERAVTDFAEHPRIMRLLQVAADSPVKARRWANLAVGTLALLQRSDHPIFLYFFDQLPQLRPVLGVEAEQKALAQAQFRLGRVILDEGDVTRANEIISSAFSTAERDSDMWSDIANSLGVTYHLLGNVSRAREYYTIVIESAGSSDESKAKSLNNRADIYDDNDEPLLAIKDRSAIVALRDTTYDRRFIAYHRRSQAYWKIGQQEAAFADITAILDTPDIAMEQKMSALLLKAEYLYELHDRLGARENIEIILGSRRNFGQVRGRALELEKKLNT